ncbi:hypothetical protein O4G76_00055 [Limimaricola sp. G21655-S1]|uniref:hypothetical protein n=1 Tax=unclassified Limimaricola TaxID=2626459 RepID=UPI0022AE76B6|nr:hypothetical protein [Limimaricola sp. G21655-S1]MCZ4259233.1 hypothetical protein [Limimaricola sp. G21655-S1]
MKSTIRITIVIGLLVAGSIASAQAARVPQRVQDFASLGWTITGHLGQSEGQERMLVRDSEGQERVAVLHSYSGLVTFEKLPHPAER